MKMNKHHTIPVASNIDWHLKNLWDDGWKTIKVMTREDHIRHHQNTKLIRTNYFNKQAENG